MFRIGVDIGGTFTDFLLCDDKGNSEVYKVLTTPKDPSEGVLRGLQQMGESKGLSLSGFLGEIQTIVHGTTTTTNALLTGRGSKAGFITTKGFRDVLNMRRGLKEDQYETKCSPPPPLIPRKLIRVVEERIDCEGTELVPVNMDDLYQNIEFFRRENVESVGVSLMFSFLNSCHEQLIKRTLETELPNVYVSVSSDILPQIRLYERNSTVALNAFVGPLLKRYLTSLTEKLRSNGFKGSLLIMQSNGGVMAPEAAMRFAANTLLSGPAGGPTAGLFYGGIHGLRNLITVDMGGTSFDVCLVKDGRPDVTVEATIAGHRLASPVIDIRTISAGGGSIAWIDQGGLLHVGPQSAGADPGPACYGLGGDQPTVTDADLVLGYLNPEYFHGGRLRLEPEASRVALEERIARKLGISVTEAAFGIYHVVNSKMASELGVVSISRGYDPREFSLVVAGGAGPIHAGMIAREMEIPLVIIPKASSVFCAAGMLMTNLRHDYVRTYVTPLRLVDFETANRLIGEMRREAVLTLEREGIKKKHMVLNYSADLRYEGQFNEVEVPLTLNPPDRESFTPAAVSLALDAFHRRHDDLYGFSMPGAPAELINLRLSAYGVTDKPVFAESAYRGEDARDAIKAERFAYFDGELKYILVYDGQRLGHGNVVRGPAIIEEPTTTIVVTPEHDVVCDRFDNYLMYPKGAEPGRVVAHLRGI